MALHFDDAAFRRDEIGMPAAHAACFKTIAVEHKVVILSRATGPTCRQLLAQGYDTKGFRIHGKSCNWGPMAGFVLRDPRFNKAGMAKADYNRREHQVALTDSDGCGWRAATTPLKLFPQRVEWLRRKRMIRVVKRGLSEYIGRAAHPTGIHFEYRLVKERTHVGEVWGVYLDNARSPFRQEGFTYHGKRPVLEPMLAMTNPPGHRSWRGEDFRNAITGDYDLFAIWPYNEDYEHEGKDKRILGTMDAWSKRDMIEHQLEAHFTESSQRTKLGNMTDRVYEICQYLNSSIGGAVCQDRGRSFGPFPSRMVAWHSTESARPFVNDIDLPVIAFAPSGLEVGIPTLPDFKAFVDNCEMDGIHVILAEGWAMDPTVGKPARLGSAYRRLKPTWGTDPLGRPKMTPVPDWYNQ